MPMWVGWYVLRNDSGEPRATSCGKRCCGVKQRYHVVVNGHTGEVHGERPRDTGKLLLAVAFLPVTLLVFVLYTLGIYKVQTHARLQPTAKVGPFALINTHARAPGWR